MRFKTKWGVIALATLLGQPVRGQTIENRDVRADIIHDTKDTKQAGKLGSVGNTGEAIGDVTVRDDKVDNKRQNANYRGVLQDVRVYLNIPLP